MCKQVNSGGSNARKQADDADLSALYRKRKNALSLPTASKRWVLARATREYSFESKLAAWSKALGQWTLATSLVVLVGIVSWRRHTDTQPDRHTLVNNVELEVEHSSDISSINEHISAQRKAGYLDYLASQSSLAVHHQAFAQVVSKRGKLELITCNQEYVTIDASVVDALHELNQFDDNISTGDYVSVSFDKTGLVLSILKPEQGPMC